jgi:hypothetical protein
MGRTGPGTAGKLTVFRRFAGRSARWVLVNVLLLQGALLLSIALSVVLGEIPADEGSFFVDVVGSWLFMNAFTLPVLPFSLGLLALLDRVKERDLGRLAGVATGPLTYFALFSLAAGDATFLEIAFFLGLPALLLGWLSPFPSDAGVERPGVRRPR